MKLLKQFFKSNRKEKKLRFYVSTPKSSRRFQKRLRESMGEKGYEEYLKERAKHLMGM